MSQEYGPNSIKSREVTITKEYQNSSTLWQVDIDESVAIRHVIERHNLNATEKQMMINCKTAEETLNAISKREAPTPKLESIRDQISGWRGHSTQLNAIDKVKGLVPKFFYTSHYDRMSGQVSAQAIDRDRENEEIEPGDKIFMDFLRLSGTSLEELLEAPKFEELNAKCEAASSHITNQIFEYWSQNDNLEVQVNLAEGLPEDPKPFDEGTVARSRVYNRLHQASVPFSERSAGFVWFFSFLIQFATMKKAKENVIILLDEPGLTLHGKAQSDLLRYIEIELLPYHQVIYSTHSPFMVPANNLSDCRIVEDVIELDKRKRQVSRGTQIREDTLRTDRDTLFPLQGALGYSITQSLFIGENTLLVEGPSDILYLQALSHEVDKRGGTPLDPRWTLCPSGGIDNLRPFVSLFAGNLQNVAVLSDQSIGEKRKIERIRQSEILAAENFHTIADLLDRNEADIEDLFPVELFCQLVNESYALDEEMAITPDSLESAASTERQVKKMEALFNTFPSEIPLYDHYRPAYWLISNGQFLSEENALTSRLLCKAEEIFAIYNKILDNGNTSGT